MIDTVNFDAPAADEPVGRQLRRNGRGDARVAAPVTTSLSIALALVLEYYGGRRDPVGSGAVRI